jgi:hypothetical protein
MSMQDKHKGDKMSFEINGPYEVNYLTVDGYAVPDVQVNVVKSPPGDVVSYMLTVDRRFMLPDITPAQFEQVAWFVANAMAVAAGYSCHGENSVANPNPYKVQVAQL